MRNPIALFAKLQKRQFHTISQIAKVAKIANRLTNCDFLKIKWGCFATDTQKTELCYLRFLFAIKIRNFAIIVISAIHF